MYYVLIIWCIKESRPHSSGNAADGDKDTNVKIPKLSEMLSAINVCITSVRKDVAKEL